MLAMREAGSPDPLGLYLADVRAVPLLTADEEIALGRRVRAGDEAAPRQLAQANVRLVIAIAKQYRGLPLADLIQEGNVGLMIAARRFDPERHCRFATFAVFWIRRTIQRAIEDKGTAIRLPVNTRHDRWRLAQARERLGAEGGREPTVAELARETGLTPAAIRRADNCPRVQASLDQLVGETQDDSLGAVLVPAEDDTAAEALALIDREAARRRVAILLARLPAKERQALALRWGLDGAGPARHTLEEVGAVMGFSRERARQLEALALRRLRQAV